VNEFLKKRIERLLESLPDERLYEVADYLEFIAARYGTKSEPATPFQRLAETVEDTLRKGRVSASVIKSTMDAMGSAGRMMSGLAAAGKAVVDQVSEAVSEGRPAPGPAGAEKKPPAGDAPPAPPPPSPADPGPSGTVPPAAPGA
jgi:hypothetical protein